MQTHVRPCEVVEDLKEDHTPPHLEAILTEAPALADQRSQCLPQGQVETFQQTRADREPECLQAFGPAAYPVDELLETALLLVLDHLAVDQLPVRLLDRLLGASRLARAWKGLQGMVDFDQCREVTAEAITEKARDAQDDGSRHLDELQGTFQRPWTNKSRTWEI